MAITHWNPRAEPTKQEEAIIRRLGRVRKFLAFLAAESRRGRAPRVGNRTGCPASRPRDPPRAAGYGESQSEIVKSVELGARGAERRLSTRRSPGETGARRGEQAGARQARAAQHGPYCR
jgi:hypothetical protein